MAFNDQAYLDTSERGAHWWYFLTSSSFTQGDDITPPGTSPGYYSSDITLK